MTKPTITPSISHTFFNAVECFLMKRSAANATSEPKSISNGIIQGTLTPERYLGSGSGTKGIHIAIKRQSTAITISGVIFSLFILNI